MRAAGQLLIALVLVYAVAAAGYSFFLLQRIESNADYAQENQLPLVLAQNRNALKIERLASLVRSAYLARDRELERQVQLQTHVLARSFTLDNNAQLADKVLEVAEQVKRIIAKREQIRRSETLAQTKTEGISAAQLDKQALEAYQSAMHLTDSLTQDLTTDAAALAYAMSGDIQKTARMIQLAWIVILILPVAIAIGALFVVARHIIAPIHTAINYLGSIDRQEAGDVKFRHPLFRELSTIFDAIQAYGRVSRDLLKTNTILHTLSEEDGLTRLANRRSFERKLAEAFNTSVERGTIWPSSWPTSITSSPSTTVTAIRRAMRASKPPPASSAASVRTGHVISRGMAAKNLPLFCPPAAWRMRFSWQRPSGRRSAACASMPRRMRS